MAKKRRKKTKAQDMSTTTTTTKAARVYRDATTGRFVTKKYAKRNPKTTVRERRRGVATET
jgi:hypothetical protein